MLRLKTKYKKQWVSALALFAFVFGSVSLQASDLPNFLGQSHLKQLSGDDFEEEQTGEEQQWQTLRVTSGDSLTGLLYRSGLDTSDISRLDTTSQEILSHIKPGEIIEIIAKNKHITWLRYHPERTSLLLVERQGEQLIGTLSTIPLVYNLNFKTVTVHSSLSASEYAGGFSNTMMADIRHMFAGTVDIDHSLYRGDSLDVLYEEYYLKGVLHHTGHVVAATLYHQHTTHTAYRYQLPKHEAGFYQVSGHSVDSLFLAFPLKFKRISSRFNRHRMDPVLHRIAPHLGIDLAARSGTPVKSLGHGRISYVGWMRGYGKTIKINYGHHLESLYGHLSRYQKHLHVGQKVAKGEVVGYVGQTGWATGPHLHFGFYVKRHAVNWLKYKKPRATTIPRAEMTVFKRYIQELQKQLSLHHDAINATQNAKN